MAHWSFLTNHARALVCIAHDPGVRLRDIAAALDITERSAYGIVTDLADEAYIVKEKDGRRNRYRIEVDLHWVSRSAATGPLARSLTCSSRPVARTGRVVPDPGVTPLSMAMRKSSLAAR